MSQGRFSFIGFADPIGLRLGFMIPVFERHGRSNALWQQVLDNSGQIVGFEHLEPQTLPIWAQKPRLVATGEMAYWGVGVGNEEVVIGQGRTGMTVLSDLLERNTLANRPMLALEIAQFVGNERHVIEQERKAYAYLATTTRENAQSWRDLSVLTPRLRSKLISVRDSHVSADWYRSLVFRVRDREVTVGGAPGYVSEKQRNYIESRTKQFIAARRDLYPQHTNLSFGWRKDLRQKTDQHFVGRIVLAEMSSDTHIAAVKMASEGLFRLESLDWLIERGDDLKPSLPNFVEVRNRLPRQLFRKDLSWRNIVVIHQYSKKSQLDDIEGLPRHVSFIEYQGPIGFPGAQSPDGFARSLVQKCHWVAAAIEQNLTIDAQFQAIVQARGKGPNPVADGLAQLFGKAHGWGMSGVPQIIAEADFTYEDRRLAEALFGKIRRNVITEITSSPLPTTRSIALLYAQSRRAIDDNKYRDGLAAALHLLGWVTQRADESIDALRLSQAGSERVIELYFALRRNVSGKRDQLWPAKREVEIDLIDTLLVTESATADDIVDWYESNGMWCVNSRDLIGWSPEGQPFWSLIRSQLRRHVGSVTSRGRSRYLRHVLLAACRHGTVDFAVHELLDSLLLAPEIGEHIQIICTDLKYKGTAAVASFSIVEARPGAISANSRRPLTHAEMIIDEEGVQLRPDYRKYPRSRD